jgi:Na+-transporting NADH:ubiquinone oxidoreductase subunit NqrA
VYPEPLIKALDGNARPAAGAIIERGRGVRRSLISITMRKPKNQSQEKKQMAKKAYSQTKTP